MSFDPRDPGQDPRGAVFGTEAAGAVDRLDARDDSTA
jgi:hypothetical protein